MLNPSLDGSGRRHHNRTIGWRFFNKRLDPRGQDNPELVESGDFIGQTADERSYEEAQRQPGDYEAQVSQRPIAIHALENRASSDAGVARLRRLIRQNLRHRALVMTTSP